jgi:hypothetical protein
MITQTKVRQEIEKDETERIKEFRSIPEYLSTIFRCSECWHNRIYGWGTPENTVVFIKCLGKCNKNTLHSYHRVHSNRRDNFDRFSDNT